jgi:hypothetical protein
MLRKLNLILALLLFSGTILCQEKINLMSGKIIEGSRISVSKGFVHYDFLSNKDNDKHPNVGDDFGDHDHPHSQIEIYRVFSIVDSTNKEKVIYTQDTLHGRNYTVDEMRQFILGEQMAYKHHSSAKNIFLSIPFGFGNGFLFTGAPIVAPFGAFIIGFVGSIPSGKVKMETSDNTIVKVGKKDLLYNSAYADGYKRVKKSKNLKNSMIGSLIGTIAGIATGYLVL